MFDFTIHHIRFYVQATTPIEMGEFKGSALRGAWTGYMHRAYCGAPPNVRTDPLHEAVCPVCYLTSRDTGAEGRRPFALQPPLSRQVRYEPGERFDFGFTLFGDAQSLFPYVLLAVREVGETFGIGRRIGAQGERGRYHLRRVEARDPHLLRKETLFQAPEAMVSQPTIAVSGESIAERTETLVASAQEDDGRITLEIQTPLRVIQHGKLMLHFSPTAFFQRLIERSFGLGKHYGEDPAKYGPDVLRQEVERLLPIVQQVQVVDDGTIWWDVKGYSSRINKPQYLGGLVGRITLATDAWTPLLPYLILGQSVQLGKNVVKGGGLYELCTQNRW